LCFISNSKGLKPMKRFSVFFQSACVLLSLSGLSCANSPAEVSAIDGSAEASETELISGRAGAVYVLTNDATSNDVIVFRRAADGSLQRAATHATTGRGSGDGLGSQGAIVLSRDRRWLFAVSAGSNELSVFSVNREALYLVDTITTGGERPVSVTEHSGLVYVVHAGAGRNDITGFVQRSDGSLAALPGSTRALSGKDVGPAQISFSPSRRALIVTEKATNKISEFRINPNTGLPGTALVNTSKGQTPFGFAITQRGALIVSEAFGGADDASAVSSYQLGFTSAGLNTISASVPNTEGAACWVALAKNDRFAYVTNTKSGTVSAYTVGTNGKVALVGTDGRAADTGNGSKPLDLAVSSDDRFLYVLEGGTASIGVLKIGANGELTVMADVGGLPASSFGIAAQ
jgi:6-phosphogluconolactonase